MFDMTLKPLSAAAERRMAYVCRRIFLLLNGFEHIQFGPPPPVTDGEPVVALSPEPRRESQKRAQAKRRKIVSDAWLVELLAYRGSGASYRQTAARFHISVAYAHRLCSESAAVLEG